MWLFSLSDDSTSEERWAWFMQRYTPAMEKQLYYEAYRILQSREEAEDALQEAIVSGAMRCWQLKDEDKLFQWMFAIVRYEAFARKKHRMRALGCLLQLSTGLVNTGLSLEDRIVSQAEAEHIAAMIENLGSPDNDIIRMKIIGGIPLKDIAAHLKLNYHTVRSRYRRALIALKRMMGD